MKTGLAVIGTYLALKALLLAVAIGVGFLLHWIIPAVDLGMAILIGLVATGLTVHFYSRLAGLLSEAALPEAEDYPDPEMIARIINPPRKWQRVPPALIVDPAPPPPRRRRNKAQPPPPPDR